MSRDPYRSQPTTKPMPKARVAHARDDGAPTLVRCPLCMGSCMVSPEVAAWLEGVMQREGDK